VVSRWGRIHRLSPPHLGIQGRSGDPVHAIGPAMASISILPPETTKPITEKGRPRTVTTTPG